MQNQADMRENLQKDQESGRCGSRTKQKPRGSEVQIQMEAGGGPPENVPKKHFNSFCWASEEWW